MANTQEGNISKTTSQSDSDYIRKTDADGSSKSILKSLLRWSATQIIDTGTGKTVIDLLAEKQNLSSDTSQIGFIDSLGQIIGSGFLCKTIEIISDIDTIF